MMPDYAPTMMDVVVLEMLDRRDEELRRGRR